MKKIICVALSLLMLGFVFTSCSKPPKADEIDLSTVESLDGITDSDKETDYVLITVEGYGEMLVRLFPDVAPETVKNFKKLVGQGFYNGLIFHRVIEDFMIQGGDPEGTGMGGSDQTIKGEFAKNGFENNLSHKRGVISMARSNKPDSASSQFFIMHKDTSYLDGQYASFGFVVYGLDTVDKIAAVNTNDNDKPLEDVVITSIKFVNAK